MSATTPSVSVIARTPTTTGSSAATIAPNAASRRRSVSGRTRASAILISFDESLRRSASSARSPVQRSPRRGHCSWRSVVSWRVRARSVSIPCCLSFSANEMPTRMIVPCASFGTKSGSRTSRNERVRVSPGVPISPFVMLVRASRPISVVGLGTPVATSTT